MRTSPAQGPELTLLAGLPRGCGCRSLRARVQEGVRVCVQQEGAHVCAGGLHACVQEGVHACVQEGVFSVPLSTPAP